MDGLTPQTHAAVFLIAPCVGKGPVIIPDDTFGGGVGHLGGGTSREEG